MRQSGLSAQRIMRHAASRKPYAARKSFAQMNIATSSMKCLSGYSVTPRKFSTFKDNYDGATAERALQKIVPKPLDAEATSKLVELLKNPPTGEESFLLDLLSNRISPGVDEAAYVKEIGRASCRERV